MGDAFSLACLQFRQAIDPARRGAMRRTRIDHAHAGPAHQRHGLARSLVRQAQQGDVAVVERLGAVRRAFALVGRQLQQAQVGPIRQPFAHLQAGGALVAIDENKRGHGLLRLGVERMLQRLPHAGQLNLTNYGFMIPELLATWDTAPCAKSIWTVCAPC